MLKNGLTYFYSLALLSGVYSTMRF